MITITQNKIAGFEPRWAPYAGFSILFDNPADSLEKDNGISMIQRNPSAGGPLVLYRGLEEALAKLNVDRLTCAYLFCPLPPSSYHVTVWDGINQGNVGATAPAIRADWTAFLAGLPLSLTAPPASMQVVSSSALKNWFGTISFRFEGLALWGDQVLVARLEAAGDESKWSLGSLCADRTVLSKEAGSKYGLDFSRDLSPHISLGYFANREHGRLASCHVEHWTGRFGESLSDSTITFRSCDVYGFTDMASFFKV